MTDLLSLRSDDLAQLAMSQCPRCAGAGKYREEGGVWDCDCRQRFLERLADAGFPPRFSHATLGDLDWEHVEPVEAQNTLREYVGHIAGYLAESFGLILSGPVGCGKTHLAIGVAKIACAYGYGVLFVNVPAWFQELRDGYASSSSLSEREWLDEMREVAVLVLDDLGAEKPSDWARERLYVVINHRSLSRRPTFITTNRSLEELEHAIGERVMSRLYGDALVIRLTGGDYRRLERERRLQNIRRTVAVAAGVR
jgi:DNA replication protein DnaC